LCHKINIVFAIKFIPFPVRFYLLNKLPFIKFILITFAIKFEASLKISPAKSAQDDYFIADNANAPFEKPRKIR